MKAKQVTENGLGVDIVVRNGKIVYPGGIIAGGVAVDEGRVVAVASDSNLPAADRIVNAEGKYILPGCIDPHSHLGVYLPFERDVETESVAAACGGVTTVMHLMGEDSIFRSHRERERSYTKLFPTYREIVETKSSVDVAFYAAMISDPPHIEEDEIRECVELGITSFKFFTAYKGWEGEQLGIQGADDGMLYLGFQRIREQGGLAMMHTENQEIIYKLNPLYRDRKDLAAWIDSRPPICEEMDMLAVFKLSETTGCPVYIVHMTVGSGVELANEYRRRGARIYLETCPHYLVLDRTGRGLKEPLLGKVNPPLRSREDQAELWSGLREGSISCVGSDNCTNMREDKLGGGDVWSALPGFGGLGTMLPLILSEGVNRGRMSLERVAAICSYNAARIQGLLPRKGVIQVGADADLVVVDLKKKAKVSPEMLHSASDYTLYDGWELTGWPVLTMVRGQVVAEDGQPTAKPGYGKYVPRARQPQS